MATYAIGDVQGCMAELETLLAACKFDRSADRLWFVGDLVNRGPASVDVLRYVMRLGSRATVVLGNHDLHLLCIAEGVARPRADDTLEEILTAPDCADLLQWLRTRPLMHAEGENILVHAGLLPQWTVAQALELAHEVESGLGGPGCHELLANLYGGEPSTWDAALTGADRVRVIVNAMTRMRFCTATGRMEFRAKGGLDSAPPGYQAWFDIVGRRSAKATVICGHWSALGLRIQPGLVSLDTGCIWGGALSAVRVEDGRLYQVSCPGYQKQGGD